MYWRSLCALRSYLYHFFTVSFKQTKVSFCVASLKLYNTHQQTLVTMKWFQFVLDLAKALLFGENMRQKFKCFKLLFLQVIDRHSICISDSHALHNFQQYINVVNKSLLFFCYTQKDAGNTEIYRGTSQICKI